MLHRCDPMRLRFVAHEHGCLRTSAGGGVRVREVWLSCRQRAGLCFQLMVIMWVLVTMGSVYGFIRVTTLAGYRQRSVVAVRERVTSPESDGVFTPHLEPNIVPAAEETQNSAGGRDAGGERQRVGPGQASGSGEGTMTKGEGSGSEVAKNDTRATLAGGTGGQSTEGKALPSSASAQMSADAHGDLGSEKGEL